MSDKSAGGKNVAFVGLGVMGYPMAGHLVNSGHNVAVFNRTRARADKWAGEYSGRIANSPAEAAAGAEIVFTCVGADDDLREIAYGEDGALAGMPAGAIFVDHTTDSADVAREVNAAAEKAGLGFLDAPVSGGQAGAENGALTVMVGGAEASFRAAEPVMQCYARNVTHMGEAGNGQLTKMVNQLCIAGVVQGLAEGINFAQRAGLDGERVLNVISKGAAQSWQMENRGSTMLDGEFEFGFAADWMRKDLGLCFEEAKKNGALLPMAMLVDQFYAHVQQRGGGRWDTSSLIQLLQKI
ncbi:MAG: NAD(P)-dependent oxidoreductase [Rhodospirillaceae bacterium]|nr:NAD(P)-dependent oxidoreductase [Rhodospirillaceae bacterium]MBT5779928.1 NAD(P)-dependent oxidoreductase [Rhodospirillaceae bacterium]MBT6828753.1 NAD(P)-dependent oxidoreductase [Rhodospirillaceae bacterium]MBT7292274.1 NAD(P)-dependent oxidoreductase [Rhodospirillaceae bacterium]